MKAKKQEVRLSDDLQAIEDVIVKLMGAESKHEESFIKKNVLPGVLA